MEPFSIIMRTSTIFEARGLGQEVSSSMSKVVFAFFFLMGLVLLYLTIMVEHQFIVAGICR